MLWLVGHKLKLLIAFVGTCLELLCQQMAECSYSGKHHEKRVFVIFGECSSRYAHAARATLSAYMEHRMSLPSLVYQQAL